MLHENTAAFDGEIAGTVVVHNMDSNVGETRWSVRAISSGGICDVIEVEDIAGTLRRGRQETGEVFVAKTLKGLGILNRSKNEMNALTLEES